MDLKSKLLDPAQTALLYGTTPPRLGTPDEQVRAAAGKLAARLAALPLDGVVVYDIQDETGRTQLPRPFPFMRTIDPRQYSTQLMQSTRLPAITYKALGNLDEAGVRYALPLSRAIRIAASDAGGFTIGGVVIAERHTALRSEAARLLAKGIEGCGYFISQTVYSARPTQRLLRDYLRDCRGAGSEPRRVVLSFAPCGREKTLAFLRWLGVTVAPDTERAILGAADPLAKSIEICRDNLRRILDEPYAGEIPLGVNVESVSINRDEIDASIDLFHALREALAGK